MKKLLLFILTLTMCLSSLISCNISPKISSDKWDGSIASSFDSGNGTEHDPYIIKSASQLAYLATQVNQGINYSEKYFLLENNIDLNNIEWTPIGYGDYYFSGYFDGNGHTISNLKISDVKTYTSTYSYGASTDCVSGLFGVCVDATICNVNIENANIFAKSISKYNSSYIGVLAGSFKASKNCKIDNIKVSQSNISNIENNFENERSYSCPLYVGGAIGFIGVIEETQFEMSRIQSDINISFPQTSSKVYNYFGGIAGYISNLGNYRCTDFASYLTLNGPEYSTNYAGAFNASNSNGIFNLSNGFSEVSINKVLSDPIIWPHIANAIIGIAYQGKTQELTVLGEYEFKNLFGYTKPIDESSEALLPVCTLYNMPSHATYSETNCQVCTTLPSNHGLNKDIWDLESPSPRLK